LSIDPLIIGAAPFALKSTAWWLYRDHIGTKIGQKLHADRAHQEVIEAEDTNALQKIDHSLSAQ
jgi:hypothetical protein